MSAAACALPCPQAIGTGTCLTDPAVTTGVFDLDKCPSLLAMLVRQRCSRRNRLARWLEPLRAIRPLLAIRYSKGRQRPCWQARLPDAVSGGTAGRSAPQLLPLGCRHDPLDCRHHTCRKR